MSCNLFSNKIATGSRDARNVAAYLAAQGDNELPPVVLEGDLSEVLANDARSEFEGHKSSHIHFQLTSRDPLSPEDLKVYLSEVFNGYGIDPDNHPYVLAEHQKQREDGSGFDKHYHLVVAYTGLDGKALRANASYIKNETISRRVEMQLGRPLGNGKFSQAVFDHALKTEDHELAAAITASGILDLPRPDARKTKKEHQIEKRTGLKVSEFRALFADAKSMPDRADKLAEIARIVRENGLSLVVGDKATKISIQHDGKHLGALDNWTDIRAKGDARADLIAEINTLNAQETPAAHNPTQLQETIEDGRTATTTRTTDATRAAAAGAAREASENASYGSTGRDQGGHERDRAEAGRSVEPRPFESVSVGPASGNDPENGRGNDRDAADLNLDSRGAGRAASGDRLSAQYDGAAPGHQSTNRALSAVDLARLRTAWTTSQPKFSAITTPLADARPRSEIKGMRPSGAPQMGCISKVQEGRLRAAFAPHQDYFSKHKVEPVHARANAAPRSQVQAKRPSLPSTKVLLNELQKARLNAALTEKRDALIAAAAFRKPDRAEEITAIRPSGAMSPDHLSKLSTKEIRDAFAHTKQLSGSAKSDAIASLLKTHGLHLAQGAKSGVITINRRLENGASEFLGSLDRFANLKTSDADRGAVIASLMSKVNVTEAKPDNLPNHEKEAPNVRDRKKQRRREALGEGRAGPEIWQHYAAGIASKAGKIAELERIRASGIREAKQLDAGRDQARHERDQELDRVRRAPGFRRAEPHRGDGSNDVADVRENGSDVADRLGSASDDHAARRELQSHAQRDRVSPATAQQAPTLTLIERVELKSAMMIYGSTIAAHSAPMPQPGPSPKPDLAPAGRVSPRKPSAPVAHSPSMGVNHAIGAGDFVTADFGDDGGDDQAKKRKAQEHSKRLSASLGPKM